MTNNINYFSLIPGDVIHLMVSYLKAKDQVPLSFVDKYFYSKYKNDSYFKELFAKQHPFLKSVSEKFFKPITDFHPSCGWKIVHCVFPEDKIFERVHGIPSSFFQAATFSIKQELSNYPIKLKSELKTICGSCYQDPSSPIDQAYKKLKKCRLELKEYENAESDFYAAIQEMYDANPHFINQVDSIFEESEQTGASIREKLAAINERLANWEIIEEKTVRLRKSKNEAKEEYNQLENRRDNLEEMQKLIPRELKKLETNPEYVTTNYRSICSDAFANAKEYEAKQSILSNLTQAITLLDSGFSEEKGYVLDKDTLKEIQNFINACSAYDISQDIWSGLYNMYANHEEEEQWSKKHFHEHLDALYILLKNACAFQESTINEILNELQENIADYFMQKAKLELKYQRQTEVEKELQKTANEKLKRDLA